MSGVPEQDWIHSYRQGRHQFHPKDRTDSAVWANVSWLKGKKAMMEASLDALNSYLVRTAYHERLDEHSRIMWNGKTYQIDPPKKDKRANECSFTMYEQA